MADIEITKEFLKALHIYMSEEISAEGALKSAGLDLTRTEFFRFMRVAYERGFVVVHSPLDPEMCEEVRGWAPGPFRIDPHVVKGNPDDRSFYLSAAEEFLNLLKKYLCDKEMTTVNIGIVSGSSTASVVEHLVESGLWEHVIGGYGIHKKQVNVIALNATPIVGWELKGNANIPTVRLAVMLQEKLPPDCKVRPFGISTDLVIKYADLEDVDKSASNREVLEIADPERLGTQKASTLNLVITGVGTPDDSVFQNILDAEEITTPGEIVGDVAFWPVDKNGSEVELVKDGERHIIYSAIRLKTMQYLVTQTNCTVMLVARNSRRGKDVDKTKAIQAAIRGHYANAIFTDAETARGIINN